MLYRAWVSILVWFTLVFETRSWCIIQPDLNLQSSLLSLLSACVTGVHLAQLGMALEGGGRGCVRPRLVALVLGTACGL